MKNFITYYQQSSTLIMAVGSSKYLNEEFIPKLKGQEESINEILKQEGYCTIKSIGEGTCSYIIINTDIAGDSIPSIMGKFILAAQPISESVDLGILTQIFTLHLLK